MGLPPASRMGVSKYVREKSAQFAALPRSFRDAQQRRYRNEPELPQPRWMRKTSQLSLPPTAASRAVRHNRDTSTSESNGTPSRK
jgi:hypothetical protein